mmetsp:Transcript_15545/g.22785  ORF Transcript_15545/g.22785 Transcript_15545/m.22785 type:complete len:252 (-) Transcript_15545:140-895(-)
MRPLSSLMNSHNLFVDELLNLQVQIHRVQSIASPIIVVKSDLRNIQRLEDHSSSSCILVFDKLLRVFLLFQTHFLEKLRKTRQTNSVSTEISIHSLVKVCSRQLNVDLRVNSLFAFLLVRKLFLVVELDSGYREIHRISLEHFSVELGALLEVNLCEISQAGFGHSDSSPSQAVLLGARTSTSGDREPGHKRHSFTFNESLSPSLSVSRYSSKHKPSSEEIVKVTAKAPSLHPNSPTTTSESSVNSTAMSL